MNRRESWVKHNQNIRKAVSHYCIEGKYFHNIKAIYVWAQAQGYTGSEEIIWRRLKSPGCTLKSLCRPPSEQRQSNGRKSGKTRKEKRKKEADEMAALIAGIDARKTPTATNAETEEGR